MHSSAALTPQTALGSPKTDGTRPLRSREMGDPVTVTTKRKCCKSGPRCKRCPVVWKRLESEGLAVRIDKRTYEPARKIPKKKMKAARH